MKKLLEYKRNTKNIIRSLSYQNISLSISVQSISSWDFIIVVYLDFRKMLQIITDFSMNKCNQYFYFQNKGCNVNPTFYNYLQIKEQIYLHSLTIEFLQKKFYLRQKFKILDFQKQILF